MAKILLRCLLLLLLIFGINTQILFVPPVSCPRYFQYQIEDFQYYGKVSIPTVSNRIELTVHLSQRQPLQNDYYGKIMLENRNPLIYRVHFPSRNEVPKITKIVVNGKTFCQQNPYPVPSTSIHLEHKLSPQPSSLGKYPQIQLPMYPAQQPPINPQPQFPRDSNNKCGIGNRAAPLVYGGDEIVPGEFPWLTAIYMKSAGLRFLCGGSLVSSRTVLSAGHCFKLGYIPADRVVVHLGRHNLEDFSEQRFVTREIQNLIIHPEYNNIYFSDADLAILHLKQPVEFSAKISPICIWPDNTDSDLLVGKSGIVAGWGANEKGDIFNAVAKKVDTKIASDSVCSRSSSLHNMLTSPRTLCAGNRDGTGPCMGDSGSGLMISRNGRWYLRGVVSAGQKTDHYTCDLKEFVIFCDVAKHMEWLQNNIV